VASNDLRLTVEEKIWSKHQKRIFAVDIEQPTRRNRRALDLVVRDPDQDPLAIRDIIARQTGIATDRKRVITHTGQNVTRMKISCDRTEPCCRGRAAIMV
jgi:hypothetical protein